MRCFLMAIIFLIKNGFAHKIIIIIIIIIIIHTYNR